MIKSAVVCAPYSYDCCVREFNETGYEVICTYYCENERVYVFDNEGIMSIMRVYE